MPVYTVVNDRWAPAAISRYLSGAFIWRTRGLDAQSLLEGLDTIRKRLSRPAILIPTDDVTAIFIAEHAATLQPYFLFPSLPSTLPRTLANKRELYLLCAKIGVPCPLSVFPTSMPAVHEFVKNASFPVIVKAAESWLLPQGAHSTSIARTPAQLYALCRGVGNAAGANLILQEYIPPVCREDWFYHGYCNRESGCCIGFTGRKLRSYPPFAGPTTLGKALVNHALREEAQELLRAVSYSGIMDLDYCLDKRDEQYKLVDFNPRIGAQFRLFEDNAGTDVARALYLDLIGNAVSGPEPIAGRTFIAEFHDIAAGIGYLKEGELTLGEWRRSLQGRREWAWFSRDDPLPFLMMCIRLLFRVVQRALGIRPSRTVSNVAPRYLRSLSRWFMRDVRKVA